MLYVHADAACLGQRCMPMSMLQLHADARNLGQGYVTMLMQHDTDMQHGYGHAAQTRTCSINMVI
jgi:hypothetical protein